MTNNHNFINEERLYSILTKVIDKLTNQVGIAEEEILDMFEISENEIKELSLKNRKLN